MIEQGQERIAQHVLHADTPRLRPHFLQHVEDADLAGPGELRVVDVDAVIDDRDRDALAARDLVRRLDSEESDAEPEIADAESPGVLPRREMTDELKRLLTCIGRLDPDRQRMVLLAYYGAFSREQLSVKLDMPVNLLKASLRRSLVEIEQCLKL